MLRYATALVLVLASIAIADAPTIKGGFAFDEMRPQKSKCAKVDGALLKKLSAKTYTCTTPENVNESASGKPLIANCQTKKQDSIYLVLHTMKDCVDERETQLANGE